MQKVFTTTPQINFKTAESQVSRHNTHRTEKKSMNASSRMILLAIIVTAVNCQSQPRLEYHGRSLPNNSFFCHPDIGEGYSALKCVTDTVGWSYE